MDKKFSWFKTARADFTAKLKIDSGLKLQDSIDLFMKLFQSKSQCSGLTAIMVAVHETAQFRHSTKFADSEKPEERAAFYVSQRAEKWAEKIMFSPDENYDDDLGTLSEGKEPDVFMPEYIVLSDSPGFNRIREMVVNPQQYHISCLAAVSLSFMSFVAPQGVLDLNPIQARSEYLIMGGPDHCLIQQANMTEYQFLARDDTAFKRLSEVCN